MKTYRKVEVDVVDEIECDMCHIKVMEESVGAGSFISIKQYCGYGSIFGDGNEIELDLCDKCFKETLGHVVRIKEEYIGIADIGQQEDGCGF